MCSPEVGGLRTEDVLAGEQLVEWRERCAKYGVEAALRGPAATGELAVAAAVLSPADYDVPEQRAAQQADALTV